MMRTGAIQIVGMEIPARDSPIDAASTAVPRRSAAAIPSGSARSSATAMPASASSMVRG